MRHVGYDPNIHRAYVKPNFRIKDPSICNPRDS